MANRIAVSAETSATTRHTDASSTRRKNDFIALRSDYSFLSGLRIPSGQTCTIIAIMSAPTIPAEKTSLSREEINRKQKEYVFPSVSTYYTDPLPMDHGSMQHVWDVEGKKYLDFFGGI